jgi:hypothetical protein
MSLDHTYPRHQSTKVHRRSGATRAPRCFGSSQHQMAPHPGWDRGHVIYVQNVICHCAKFTFLYKMEVIPQVLPT